MQKLKLAPGLVFAIPLPSGGFAYGKLLFTAPWRDVAKIYTITSSKLITMEDVIKSDVKLPLIFIAGSGIQSGDWPVIGSESLNSSEDISDCLYVMGLPPTHKVQRIADRSFVRIPNSDDLVNLPSAIAHHEYHIQDLFDPEALPGKV